MITRYDINNNKYLINTENVIYTKVVDQEYTLYHFVDGSEVELKLIQADYSKRNIPITRFEDIKY